jgi:hypothetical protein
MKIYGKRKKSSVRPIRLNEVALLVNAKELGDLIMFFTECQKQMGDKEQGLGHAHLADFLEAVDLRDDIVVVESRRGQG